MRLAISVIPVNERLEEAVLHEGGLSAPSNNEGTRV